MLQYPSTGKLGTARFDDCSEDIRSTELVARATDAAALFNANNFPLPSDSDEEDAGKNPDPLRFLPAILHTGDA